MGDKTYFEQRRWQQQEAATLTTPIRALSLWEPWAILIPIGAKQFETRGWQTTWRGSLVIHAALYKGELDVCRTSPFREVLATAGITRLTQLPLGAALCVVDLVDCVPTADVLPHLSDQELAFGNYGPGRFAWKLANVRRFKAPVPYLGRQGIWAYKGSLDLEVQ